jgi:hypothetical protein
VISARPAGSAPALPRSRGRSSLYPRAILLAVGIAFLVVVVTGSGSDAVSGRLGGDYPAFYAAGELARDDPGSLYSPVAQGARQDGLFGAEGSEGFLYFAYPPYVTIPYEALSLLPYRLSYVVHTFLMTALVIAALWILRPLVPLLRERFEHAVAGSLLFFPMFVGIFGGQNTAVVLFLLAVAFRALHDDRDVLAGLALACLLFKPQYALLVVGLSLLVRRVNVMAGFVVGAAGLFLAGVFVQGWGWVGPWLDQVRWFTELDAEVNAVNAVSWLGMAEALWGAGAPAAWVVGGLLASATAAGVAWVWWADRGRHLGTLMALTVPALVLIAPHAMFYDAGLLVVPLLALASAGVTRPVGLVVLYGASFLQVAASAVGFSPLGPVTVAVFIWVSTAMVRSPRAVAPMGAAS